MPGHIRLYKKGSHSLGDMVIYSFHEEMDHCLCRLVTTAIIIYLTVCLDPTLGKNAGFSLQSSYNQHKAKKTNKPKKKHRATWSTTACCFRKHELADKFSTACNKASNQQRCLLLKCSNQNHNDQFLQHFFACLFKFIFWGDNSRAEWQTGGMARTY